MYLTQHKEAQKHFCEILVPLFSLISLYLVFTLFNLLPKKKNNPQHHQKPTNQTKQPQKSSCRLHIPRSDL